MRIEVLQHKAISVEGGSRNMRHSHEARAKPDGSLALRCTM